MESNRLYELVLTYKNQMESRREEINKYYTSLFAGLISFMPFIDKITDAGSIVNKSHNLRYILILLSCLGFILAISWKLSLSRIYDYIKGTEELLVQMEKSFEMGFITHMSKYLHNAHSPSGVTKQQMLVPNAFAVVFTIIFTYSVSWLLF